MKTSTRAVTPPHGRASAPFRRELAALALGAAFGACAAPATPKDIPAEAFFDPPELQHPVLSPSGDALAMLVRGADGHRQLAILSTSDPSKMKIAARFAKGDVIAAAWVNDERLLFWSGEEDLSAGKRRGGTLFAVDRDGNFTRQLTGSDRGEAGTRIHEKVLVQWQHDFERTLDDGSDDVVMSHFDNHVDGNINHFHVESSYNVPLRLNTRTGATTQLVPPPVPAKVVQWLIDGHGRVMGAMQQQEGRRRLLVRDDATGVFAVRNEFEAYGDREGAFNVREVAADGRVYVTRSNARSELELARLDLATGKPETAPVVSVKGFDFDGGLVEDVRQHKVVGAHYVSDAAGTAWFDPELEKLQDAVDKRLRGRINRISLARCGCAPRVLVSSFSDRQPPQYFLYDRMTGELLPLGDERRNIDAAQMGSTDFTRIKARDGHDLPVYVTRPKGKGPWPTVVLVHGGPFLRGWEWNWDDESQFLASRGYLVVKPEFRASEGYGFALYHDGFKQWGLKSQDDIADATRWAIDQGLADGKRVCIAGASYGGYATLMGLVRYGDLYRCGVAWAAVSDIDLMYDLWWSDMGDEWKGYGMPEMIGDRVKDAEQLAATSPLRQADKITRPLLLAHGGADRRVPVEHAQRMRDALASHHAPVTWIEYRDEGHGWFDPATRAAFYRRVEAFLAENDGPASAAR